jgi:hypothetical protein
VGGGEDAEKGGAVSGVLGRGEIVAGDLESVS